MNARDMTPIRRTATHWLLLFFAVWDLGLAALAVLWPDQWFAQMHGIPRVDPEALLARTGMVWLAFSFFHLVAFTRWKRNPYWLVVVGGMRLSEIFADLAYLQLAHDVTSAGRMALALAAPTNVLFAVFFIQGYLEIQTTTDRRLEKAESRVGDLERQLAEATKVPMPACPPAGLVPVGKLVGEPAEAAT